MNSDVTINKRKINLSGIDATRALNRRMLIAIAERDPALNISLAKLKNHSNTKLDELLRNSNGIKSVEVEIKVVYTAEVENTMNQKYEEELANKDETIRKLKQQLSDLEEMDDFEKMNTEILKNIPVEIEEVSKDTDDKEVESLAEVFADTTITENTPAPAPQQPTQQQKTKRTLDL